MTTIKAIREHGHLVVLDNDTVLMLCRNPYGTHNWVQLDDRTGETIIMGNIAVSEFVHQELSIDEDDPEQMEFVNNLFEHVCQTKEFYNSRKEGRIWAIQSRRRMALLDAHFGGHLRWAYRDNHPAPQLP